MQLRSQPQRQPVGCALVLLPSEAQHMDRGASPPWISCTSHSHVLFNNWLSQSSARLAFPIMVTLPAYPAWSSNSSLIYKCQGPGCAKWFPEAHGRLVITGVERPCPVRRQNEAWQVGVPTLGRASACISHVAAQSGRREDPSAGTTFFPVLEAVGSGFGRKMASGAMGSQETADHLVPCQTQSACAESP